MSDYIAEALSSTMSDEELADEGGDGFSFVFELGTGNIGIKTITELLLNTEAKAYERARSEFLKNGYRKNIIAFRTWRTDFSLNQIIFVEGLRYKITKLSIKSDVKSTITSVTGARYE